MHRDIATRCSRRYVGKRKRTLQELRITYLYLSLSLSPRRPALRHSVYALSNLK